MDLLNTIPSKPLEPHIDLNGQIVCPDCYGVLNLTNNKCPSCNKDIDWSWLDDRK